MGDVPTFNMREAVLGARGRVEGTISSSFRNIEELSAVQFCRVLSLIETSQSRLPKTFRDYLQRAHFFYRKEALPILKKGLCETAHQETQDIFGNFTMADKWYAMIS